MKKILFLGSIVVLFGMASCKKDNPLSPLEEATMKLTDSPWGEPVVTVDGVDYSDLYKNFEIEFSEVSYASSGGSPVWATSGTWTFIDEGATHMKLDGNREIEISLSGDFLELSFQWEEDTFEQGRLKSVKGKQKCKLKKKKR